MQQTAYTGFKLEIVSPEPDHIKYVSYTLDSFYDDEMYAVHIHDLNKLCVLQKHSATNLYF